MVRRLNAAELDIKVEYEKFRMSRSSTELYSRLHTFLQVQGYEPENVLVRFLCEENLENILLYGTDRRKDGNLIANEASFDPLSEGFDSMIMRRFRLRPSQFTYCLYGVFLKDLCGAQILRQQTKASTLWRDEEAAAVLLAVYDKTKMRILDTDAVQFEDDPKACLLGLYRLRLK